ncbi:MAG: TonB-dependent receptor plug domain-containing protein, partial [Acidobacteria bacterium]|nr:TonB-dependent receptor plug domain-containing protein [Acidobacteriota bacterium]
MLTLLFALALQVAPAVQVPVAGTVRDTTGAAIANATIAVQGSAEQAVSGVDGRFVLTPRIAGPVVLVVRAPGFSEWRRSLPPNPTASIEIVLMPAGVLETLTVTPARSAMRLGDVPASMSVLTREDLRQSPAVLADDVLRRLPAFSLFRRTSSMAAHPTAQGVSLRGIGPSGVSRTLVLVDGVPFNDPFGGSGAWSRLPREQADRVAL